MNKILKKIESESWMKINKIKKCKYCNSEFAIYDIEKKMLDKHLFKDTEQCPSCTFKIHNSSINDRHLYSRIDSETREDLVSILSPNYTWKIIEAKRYKKMLINDYALNHTQDISQDIFTQFTKMYDDFPKPSRLIYPSLENAEYASHCWWAKNLYLSYCVFTDCEDIYYSFKVTGWSKDVFNSYNISSSSNIYSSSTIGNSHNVSFSRNSVDSSDLIFCRDMNNCHDCIFCWIFQVKKSTLRGALIIQVIY